jgi:formylglycine-generating enzyme required for sulfatase activity
MYGNVAEWCNDIFSTAGDGRVVRGGSWMDSEETLTSSWRGKDISINDACALKDTIGFRCVKKAD